MFKIAKLNESFVIVTEDDKKILTQASDFDESRMYESFVNIADSVVMSSGVCKWKQGTRPKFYDTLEKVKADLHKLNELISIKDVNYSDYTTT